MIISAWAFVPILIYTFGTAILLEIIGRRSKRESKLVGIGSKLLAHCGDDDADWDWFKGRTPEQTEAIAKVGEGYRGPPTHMIAKPEKRLSFSWTNGIVVGMSFERSNSRWSMRLFIVMVEVQFHFRERRVKMPRGAS
jgi:hypothetical protein